jgi:hypothetical protein
MSFDIKRLKNMHTAHIVVLGKDVNGDPVYQLRLGGFDEDSTNDFIPLVCDDRGRLKISAAAIVGGNLDEVESLLNSANTILTAIGTSEASIDSKLTNTNSKLDDIKSYADEIEPLLSTGPVARRNPSGPVIGINAAFKVTSIRYTVQGTTYTKTITYGVTIANMTVSEWT